MKSKKMDYIFAFAVFNVFFCVISNNVYLKVFSTTLLVIIYFADRKIRNGKNTQTKADKK